MNHLEANVLLTDNHLIKYLFSTVNMYQHFRRRSALLYK